MRLVVTAFALQRAVPPPPRWRKRAIIMERNRGGGSRCRLSYRIVAVPIVCRAAQPPLGLRRVVPRVWYVVGCSHRRASGCSGRCRQPVWVRFDARGFNDLARFGIEETAVRRPLTFELSVRLFLIGKSWFGLGRYWTRLGTDPSGCLGTDPSVPGPSRLPLHACGCVC